MSSKPLQREDEFICEGHLGGTSINGDINSWFPELWHWLVSAFSCRTVLDVGCGCGQTQWYFNQIGCETLGLDGCRGVLSRHLLPEKTVEHDLTTGAWLGNEPFDLVWCCECAEHVEPRYEHNVIETLVKNTGYVLAFCAAPPLCGGYHHVNCQPVEHWISRLSQGGLHYDHALTTKAKSLCGVAHGRTQHNYFCRSGLIFVKELNYVASEAQ